MKTIGYSALAAEFVALTALFLLSPPPTSMRGTVSLDSFLAYAAVTVALAITIGYMVGVSTRSQRPSDGSYPIPRRCSVCGVDMIVWSDEQRERCMEHLNSIESTSGAK